MEQNLIISLATYSLRFPTLPKVLNSLVNQSMKPWKIVVNMDDVDVKNITPEIQEYLDRDDFELILSPDAIRPHKKYYYTMLKYRKNPIITVDDDMIYNTDMVQSLYQSYKEHPDCISAMETVLVGFHINGKPKLKTSWKFHQIIEEPTHSIVAEGVGGVLYPPNILQLKKNQKFEMYDFICEDDLYLKMLEVKKDIKVITAKSLMNLGQRGIHIKEGQEKALVNNNSQTGSKEYIDKIPPEIWEKIKQG